MTALGEVSWPVLQALLLGMYQGSYVGLDLHSLDGWVHVEQFGHEDAIILNECTQHMACMFSEVVTDMLAGDDLCDGRDDVRGGLRNQTLEDATDGTFFSTK